MKIAFIWYFDKASDVYDNWLDGLRSAMYIVGKKHMVTWFLDKNLPDPEDKYDYYLVWDDSNTESTKYLPQGKKGLFLTTYPNDVENLRKFDAVFCESEPIYSAVRAQGIKAVKAFGTDTDFFKPGKLKKDIEYFYPATFSPWKRQSEIAYLGEKLLCVGTVQPDGENEYNACKENGVRVEVGYFPAKKILNYYQRSKNVIIPAVHGSERTVLEAMSCNILPIITNQKVNSKAYSYIDEFNISDFPTPRQFVIAYYSYKIYADRILEVIEE